MTQEHKNLESKRHHIIHRTSKDKISTIGLTALIKTDKFEDPLIDKNPKNNK